MRPPRTQKCFPGTGSQHGGFAKVTPAVLPPTLTLGLCHIQSEYPDTSFTLPSTPVLNYPTAVLWNFVI